MFAPMNMPPWIWVIAPLMILSFRIVIGLWLLPDHKEVGRPKRVLWSVLALFPLIPLLREVIG